MGRSILVTGGARSGKSKYGEQLARELNGPMLYVATAIPFDEEMKERIRKHQAQRPMEWDTHEGYQGIGDLIQEKGNQYAGVLLDCITVMVTNLLFDFLEGDDLDYVSEQNWNKIEGKIEEEIQKMLEAMKDTNATIIFITNELGSGIVPEAKLGRVFRDIAGRINQRIASQVDEVYLTVCGIPVRVK